MFVNQRLQIDIGQNVAAVGQEMLAAEIAFCILDATASLQQFRFVNKRHRTAGIVALTKKVSEQFGIPVGVNNELVYSCANQLIECKSDKRLLKNRNEWLRQILR